MLLALTIIRRPTNCIKHQIIQVSPAILIKVKMANLVQLVNTRIINNFNIGANLVTLSLYL